jgi:hypothetical protein
VPLSARKAKLAKLLARKPAGIVFNEHTEEDGAVVFWHACKLGFEGIVSKRLNAPYRSRPSRSRQPMALTTASALCRADDSLSQLWPISNALFIGVQWRAR